MLLYVVSLGLLGLALPGLFPRAYPRATCGLPVDYEAQTRLVDVARHYPTATLFPLAIWSLLHGWDLDFLHVCVDVFSLCWCLFCLLRVVVCSGWLAYGLVIGAGDVAGAVVVVVWASLFCSL